MRIILFFLFTCSLTMCKTKDVLPADQLLNYVVILKGESTPKALKKDISFELVDFKKANKTLNQWTLDFKSDPKKEKNLKAELLNHPIVVSVYTKEQFDKINLKNGQKAKVGAIGRRNATKQ